MTPIISTYILYKRANSMAWEETWEIQISQVSNERSRRNVFWDSNFAIFGGTVIAFKELADEN